MSGGNETPRQKMIGMMYLVLTALLALNVSTAVLEKFAIIDDTLGKLIVENTKVNDSKYISIEKSNFEGAQVVKSKDQALKIKALTGPMLTYLENLRKQMATEKKTGKEIERAELVLNTNNSEEIMINHSEPTVGEEYKNKLTNYVDELNKIMAINPPFPQLTRTAKDYDEFKEGHNKDKGFLEFAFEGVPTMAAIATVSEVSTEIQKYEATALDTLYKRVHGQTYEVDQMVPLVQSVSNTLVPGQFFEGDLFVAGSASGANPEMFFGGNPLKVEDKTLKSGIKIKVGKIRFPVRGASNYVDGKAKASFNVKINLPGTKPLNEDVEYFILKPAPRFASAAASTLYMNCGNEQTVSIVGLTDVSTLSLSVPAAEGSVQKLSPGKFVIIPTREKCHVTVLLDGINIDTQEFTTKAAPRPIAKITYSGNTVYNEDIGLPAGTANIRLEADLSQFPDFVTNNRKDANYQVASYTIRLDNGGVVQVKGATASIAAYNLKSGGGFNISDVKVLRTTYDGRQIDVLGSNMSKRIKIK